jgi:signal transduction histidine kinase
MSQPSSGFSRQYKTALRTHLDQKGRANPLVTEQIGNQIRLTGLPMLDFARLHENVVVMEILPGCPPRKQASLIRKAGNFFAATISASITENESSRNASHLEKIIESLSERTVELAATNRQLGLEIIELGKVETTLRESERDSLGALEKSEALQKQLRDLFRRILSTQEEERKKISRELQNVVAQALLAINVRLATLKKEAGMNTRGLDHNISQTQKIITKSTDIVHQFARELRPAVLDDLGLISAIESFMKNFTTRTGIRTYLTVFDDVEAIDTAKRTALYRVVQESLNNISRHAHASRVDVTIRKETKSVIMEVSDDGRSFQIKRTLADGGTKRLGLIGMRERLEMVGGNLEIESIPGKGTTIIARLPYGPSAGKNMNQSKSAKNNPEKP